LRVIGIQGGIKGILFLALLSYIFLFLLRLLDENVQVQFVDVQGVVSLRLVDKIPTKLHFSLIKIKFFNLQNSLYILHFNKTRH
jgi:hypothetical protein